MNIFKRQKNNIKPVLSLIVVLIIGFSTIITSFMLTMHKAKAENNDTIIAPDGSYSAFLVNGNPYNTLFYSSKDGQIVYCTEHDYLGPTSDSEYTYSSEQSSLTKEAQQGIECILSYGYIGFGNEAIFNEYSLTKEQARAATQTAIHTYLCDRKEIGSGYSYNYSSQFSAKQGEENTWNAMKWLYSKAINLDENKSTAAISIISSAGKRDGLYYVAEFELNTTDYEYEVYGLADNSYTTEKNDNIITVKALFKANIGNSIRLVVNSTEQSQSYNVGYYISKTGALQTMVGGAVTQQNPSDEAVQPIVGKYDEYGWLKIIKKDSQTGELLNNAVFNVYTNSGCTGEPVAQLSSGRSYVNINEYNNTKGIAQIPIDAGTYYIKEAASPYGYEKSDRILKAEITYNETTELIYENDPVANKPFSIIKRSAEDGNIVTGATYSLYDITSVLSENEQNIGEWMLNASSEIRNGNITATEYGFIQSATTNNEGVAIFDSSLMDGRNNHTIMMIETSAPEGYQIDPAIYILYYSGIEWNIASEYEINNTVSDYYKPGKIQIKKTNKEGEPLSGAVYGIYMDKTCTKPAHYVCGYETYGYCLMDSDGNLIYEDGDATITTDANGQGTTGYLASGTYYIKEITAPAGYKLSDDIKSVYTGYKTDLASITFANEKIEGIIEIHKTDRTNPKINVQGATYGLYLNGQLYKTFPATNEYGYAKLTNLPLGDYSVKEITAPDGYELDDESHSVTFKLFSDGSDTVYYAKMEVSDPPIINMDTLSMNISKTDQFGNYVQGATLQLLDYNNNVVDEWMTDGRIHKYSTTKSGSGSAGVFSEEERKFTLREANTPEGYTKAEDITFVIDSSKKTINVNMIDATESGIYVDKVDENGSSVSGATLQLINKAGNVIDEWVSDGTIHFFDYESYLKKEKNVTDLTRANLTEDDYTFILHEKESPENYYIAEDIAFDVSKETYTAVVKMVDKRKEIKITVIKTNDDGEALAGATLQVIDAKGNVCDEWISDGGRHIITGVELGKTYTLHEAKAPYGYELADDVIFTVPEEEDMNITMTDHKIPDVKTCKIYVFKEDNYGTPLEGAVLGLFDTEGNELFRWTSTKEAYVIDNLPVGETYIIQEISAPDGYEVADNISVTTKEEDITIYVVDNSIETEIVQTGEKDNIVKIIVYSCLFILGICSIIITIDQKKTER